MKKLIPIGYTLALISALTCAFLIKFSGFDFSIIFKTMLLSLSAFICLLCLWKSNFNLVCAVLGVVSFVGLAVMLIQQGKLYHYWNIVLTLHILLIGIVLYKDAKAFGNSLLAKLTQASVIATIGSIIVLLLGRIQQEWPIMVSLSLFAIMFVLILLNKLKPFTKEK